MFLSPAEYGLTADQNALECLIATGANSLNMRYKREELHMDGEPSKAYLEMLAAYILYTGSKDANEQMARLYKEAQKSFDAKDMSDNLLRFLADSCKPEPAHEE